MSWKIEYYLNEVLYFESIEPSRSDVIRVACEKFPMHIRAPNYNWERLTQLGWVNLGSGGVITIEETSE